MLSFGEVVNWLVLVLAVVLFIATLLLVRPANGSRPLLVGFGASSVIAVIIGLSRVFDLSQQVRPWFGVAVACWLLVKLWALLAIATHRRRPILYFIGKLGRQPLE